MSVCTGGEGREKSGSAGSGSGSCQGSNSKMVFWMQIVFAFQPQEKKIMCVEVSPKAACSWEPTFQLPSCPTPSCLPFSKPFPTNPPHPRAGSGRCSLSTSPLSATLQLMGQGIAGSGFWHPLVQAGWVRRGLGWMGTG